MTAAGIDSMVLKYSLVDIDADGLETQEEVPGITLAAQLEPEVATLELLLNQDNISISVVSEFGLDLNQLDQNQEPMEEVKLDSDLLDRVLSILDGDQPIQSRLMLGETDLETEYSLHASILKMIEMELGGLVISKVLTTSDWYKS